MQWNIQDFIDVRQPLQRLSGQLESRGPLWLAIMLSASLLLESALVYRSMSTGPNSRTAHGSGAVRTGVAAGGFDLSRLNAAHLFGLEPGSAAPAAPTQLPLILTGTISMTGDPTHGSAIIGSSAASTRLVGVGEEVASGVLLTAVYGDYVTLSRNGSEETLTMPRALPGNWFAQSAREDDSKFERQVPELPNIAELRSQATAEGAAYSRLFTAKAAVDGELYHGITVNPGTNAELFEKLGFKPGDTIAAIDGVPLSDPAMLRELSSGRTVTVGVHRPEGDVTIEINTAALGY
jgi:general secretion pathway protein C